MLRLKQEVAAAEIDVFVVIGDDQYELFDYDNTPALAVYTGAELEFTQKEHTPAGRRGRLGEEVGGLDDVRRGYGVDQRHRWPGHQPLAVHMIGGLLERHFDVTAVTSAPVSMSPASLAAPPAPPPMSAASPSGQH